MIRHVRSYLDLSTAHVTADDDSLLRIGVVAAEDGPLVRPYEYGYWVWVPDQEDLEVYLAEYTKNGFSSTFIKVLRYARENGCDWINFDRDATACDDLPTHEW